MAGFFDTAMIAVLVSAAVTALGWYATHASERRLEDDRRMERIIDIQTALLAEIDSNLVRYGETDLDEHEKHMTALILKPGRGESYTPFVPRDSTEIVFATLLHDIHLLPSETIGDVVSYYKQEYKLEKLIDDLRGETFRALDRQRKAHLYADYVWQIKTVVWEGETARASLSKSLGRQAPERLVNIREAARIRASENRFQA